MLMNKQHHYQLKLQWTGNTGTGTTAYHDYERAHEITAGNKAVIQGSSDPAFRGDHSRYNPEELLVAALASCHMLWYLHLCAQAGVVVLDYRDEAKGVMEELKDGSGHFREVTLHPVVIVKEECMLSKAEQLHKEAHRLCFIANSVNFPVQHQPETHCS